MTIAVIRDRDIANHLIGGGRGRKLSVEIIKKTTFIWILAADLV